MGVSKNRGTPKWMIWGYPGNPYFWGYTPYILPGGNFGHLICIVILTCSTEGGLLHLFVEVLALVPPGERDETNAKSMSLELSYGKW